MRFFLPAYSMPPKKEDNNPAIPLIVSVATTLLKKTNSKTPLLCQECDLSFQFKSRLERHMQIKHSDEKPFHCNWDGCDKAFSQPCSLTRHLRTHSGEKPYKCITCSKAFSDRSNFNSHLRTHSDEKPFDCNWDGCDKAFSQASYLKKHLHSHTHTGKKPLHCNFYGCDKKLTKPSDLTRHLRTHSGEKPYHCDLDGCDKAFSQEAHLKRHKFTHINKSCLLCNQQFESQKKVMDHFNSCFDEGGLSPLNVFPFE